MKAISQDIVISGQHPLSEWDDPSTPSVPGCLANRNPVSSAVARALLIASLEAGDGCIKWVTVTTLDLTP
jgi:hypothetical protein